MRAQAPEPPELPQPTTPRQSPPKQFDFNSPLAPPSPESAVDIPGTIVVRKFEFVGSTVFSDAELAEAVAKFRGKPISFARLLQAADKISELYIQQGYITSGAYIPAQNLESDTVQIQIVEGSVSNVEIDIAEGRLNPDYVRARLERAIAAPLNIDKLQEALQLLQFNPLIASLDAELAAGIRPGTNSLTVSVTEADTFFLQPSINNSRNPVIGTFERRIEVIENNLFGIGDGINFAYSNTDGSDSFEGGYTLPVNAQNGTVSFDFRIADNEIIEPPFEDLDIEIDSRDFALSWRQPVIQRATPQANQEVALELIASRRESDTSIVDVDYPLSPGASEDGETRISALRLAQEWLRRDRVSVISARSQLNLGIDAFDATINDVEPDGQFFAWRGQLLYLRLLGRTTFDNRIPPTLLLRSDLQLAADPLLTVEQFSLGGGASVRGYRQDDLLTDSGWFASAEVRLPIASSERWGTVQLTPFVDWGTGWNADDEATDFNTLIGTGVGVLWELPERLEARVDFGIPLINTDSDDRTWQENGVYFQLRYNIQ
ncbi:ShlB/FhaC/HecB family hemolysin secretion/activation protein [Myxosarcina sp. GI1]|uniref:ShlB/FhaC/HecB family hemolysin secretion/activation protein n=1 Tax=Myxosarcina sp. GI1 TaxID=1541065 RepID=UPI00068C670F|nr:ShlB/FhaC/HecB family hemolysin secretion/activation protein [Myxosarcina sp. GI1]